MKKFMKPLIINVPQDNHHEVKSPSHLKFNKQNNKQSLFLYNEHTIASSANNQDELVQQDEREMTTCQQFVEFHHKEDISKGQSHQHQQQQGLNNKLQKLNKKFNVIEFQQFCVEGDKSNNLSQTAQTNHSPIQSYQKKHFNQHNQRKQFSIEIPQNQEKQQKSGRFAFDLKSEHVNKSIRQSLHKQPPAPSNKSKLAKTLNRHFVFPTSDEQVMQQALTRKQKQPDNKGNFILQEQHDKKMKELNDEWSRKLQTITKSFQKERQQFYKEKSSLEKDLMIRDGQIQMLQKLITNRYSPKSGNLAENTSNQTHKRQSSASFNKFQLQQQRPRNTLFLSDQKINTMQTILLQKDLQINSLLQKINQLNSEIDAKNNEIEQVKVSLMKSQKMNESMRNDIFIHQNKEQSEKLTKQFFKVKEGLIIVQQSSKTPKGFSRPKWQQDVSVQKDVQKSDFPFRGIDDLHKRLQSLKMNRIQLQNRGRIKSQIGYAQTSKNKTKGTFDFKGKFYDRERDYITRGGNY